MGHSLLTKADDMLFTNVKTSPDTCCFLFQDDEMSSLNIHHPVFFRSAPCNCVLRCTKYMVDGLRTRKLSRSARKSPSLSTLQSSMQVNRNTLFEIDTSKLIHGGIWKDQVRVSDEEYTIRRCFTEATERGTIAR